MFDGSPMLRNLIPIKVTSLADAERKLFAAQDLYSKLSGDRAKAKYALSIAKTAQQKKDAQKALHDLNNSGATEDAVDTMRQETLPELQRLVNAAEDKFGSAKTAPAVVRESDSVSSQKREAPNAAEEPETPDTKPDIPKDTGGNSKADGAATAALFPGASQEFLARIAKYEDGGEPVVIVRGAFVPDAEYTLYGKGYRQNLS